MNLYLARHGQTDWNIEMRAQGRKDIPLNSTGRARAEAIRNKIKDLKFDVAYTSPLQRTAETAKIAVGDRCKIIYDDRLIERSFGDFEGQILDSWAQPVKGVNIDDITLKEIPGNVETVSNMLTRVNDFIEYLKQTYDSNAKILIISHSVLSKAFDWLLLEHKENNVFGATHLANTEVKEYTL